MVASCCCCACQSLWCQLLHWCSGVGLLHHCLYSVIALHWCSGVVLLHHCLYSVIALHWWGQLFGALHAGVCGIICTGGASCLVHYMQVSVASFAQVEPVVWCTTCRCLWHHLHWWGQLFGALHAGVCGIICTGGASCLVHYMQVSAASFALGPAAQVFLWWCCYHWWSPWFPQSALMS